VEGQEGVMLGNFLREEGETRRRPPKDRPPPGTGRAEITTGKNKPGGAGGVLQKKDEGTVRRGRKLPEKNCEKKCVHLGGVE